MGKWVPNHWKECLVGVCLLESSEPATVHPRDSRGSFRGLFSAWSGPLEPRSRQHSRQCISALPFLETRQNSTICKHPGKSCISWMSQLVLGGASTRTEVLGS